MTARGTYTREEIISQPEAWMQAIAVLNEQYELLREFSRAVAIQQVLFTGCGSTYYLSLAAAAMFQEMTGISARALPASEVWLSPQSSISATPTILIAISRSGETSETVKACEAYSTREDGKIITLVCQPGSTLTRMGLVNLVFPSGMEKSIAQTRAFSTLYLGATGLSMAWTDGGEQLACLDTLPSIANRIITDFWSKAAEYGQNLSLDRIYFLGSGGRFGLACELNLKMKEMSLTHSEAFHFMEFRHGPKAMVNEKTLIVGLVSKSNAFYENAVLSDMRELGAEIVTMGENNADVSFNSGLEEVRRNVLYLPFGQIMAFERALAKNLDPDRPHNLDPVVKLAK
jgi:glutamine---fructose-6-phosphate transaminase (isomerizing)